MFFKILSKILQANSTILILIKNKEESFVVEVTHIFCLPHHLIKCDNHFLGLLFLNITRVVLIKML